MIKFRLFNRKFGRYDFDPNHWKINWDRNGFYVTPVFPRTCFLEFALGRRSDDKQIQLFSGDIISAIYKKKPIRAVLFLKKDGEILADSGEVSIPLSKLSNLSLIGNANLDVFIKPPLIEAIDRYRASNLDEN